MCQPPPPLRRPAPAQYFHSLFLIFQIKIYFLPLKKVGGRVRTMNNMDNLALYQLSKNLFVKCIVTMETKTSSNGLFSI